MPSISAEAESIEESEQDVELETLAEYEDAARRVLPAHLWEFVARGAGDGHAVRRNRAAFEALALRPRYLRDVGTCDLTTSVLGTELSMPIFLSPAGRQTNAHPDGELASASGAQRAGTLLVVPSSPAPASHAEIAAQVDVPLWCQFYHTGRASSAKLLREVEEAGYRAICVTCDTPVVYLSRHQRAQLTPAELAERQGVSYRVTPADLEWLCNATSLPVVAKGLITAEDARVAVEHGARAVFVSNHGGRGFGVSLSTIESLPEVVAAVRGRAEIYLDGGIRAGTDVLAALALGADAVGVGRPLHWGLAVGGADGVHSVLEILRRELGLALARTGQSNIRDLDPDLVALPPHWE